MKQILIDTIVPSLISFATTIIVLKLLVKYSAKLKLVDVPNQRKVHKMPIPSIGGLVIIIALAITCSVVPQLRLLVNEHISFFLALILLLVIGVADDRFDISAALRFAIEIGCAYLVTQSGMRLTSLYGIFGITQLPIVAQYMLTIFIIVGVTNAFNLIDGIDGLVGSIAIINLIILSSMCVLCNAINWLPLLVAAIVCLLVFIKYNWRPAKLFMGDGGSLVLGFAIVTLAIFFIEKTAHANHSKASQFVAMLAAAFMIPVIDTLRVFYVRLKSGRSPFSADKNHLHHWLIRQHLMHSQATKRVIGFHIFLLIFAYVATNFISTSLVILLLIAFVLLYTKLLQLSSYFHRWYKFVKRMEAAN